VGAAIDMLKMRRAGASSHAVVITPNPLDASGNTSTITTGDATANVTGGVGPFTYAWTFDSNPGGLTILSAAAAATQFRKTGAASGEIYNALARCTATDTGNGNVMAFDTVNVSIERTV
jgi:hypothetical protein